MRPSDAAAKLKKIQEYPITGFPCRNCGGSGLFQDSWEGGIWTLCDCPANMRDIRERDKKREEKENAERRARYGHRD